MTRTYLAAGLAALLIALPAAAQPDSRIKTALNALSVAAADVQGDAALDQAFKTRALAAIGEAYSRVAVLGYGQGGGRLRNPNASPNGKAAHALTQVRRAVAEINGFPMQTAGRKELALVPLRNAASILENRPTPAKADKGKRTGGKS